jgi:hypothetical protein
MNPFAARSTHLAGRPSGLPAAAAAGALALLAMPSPLAA